MIFIWGLLQDATTRSVYECLAERNAPIVFVNHADVAHTTIKFSSDKIDSYHLSCGELSLELTELTSAYLRPFDHRDYHDYVSPKSRSLAIGGPEIVHHLIGSWAEGTDAMVINRPSAEATNHSKLFQATLILASGFSVPASLVSNDPDQIREFHIRHKQTIYKSMSSVRSVVKEFEMTALDGIGRMGPVLFQQRVMGENIRVHVIRDKAFACLIQSDGVDYRYAPSQFASFSLPSEVANRCIRLCRLLGLVLAGIDLIRTSSGEWYCLEANPNPAFACYDLTGDKVIAAAVADELIGK